MNNSYEILLEVELQNPVFKERGHVFFRTSTFNNTVLQVRQYSKKRLFYEVDRNRNEEFLVRKETVNWLIKKKRVGKKDKKRLKKYL